MALLALGILVLIPRTVVAGVDDERFLDELEFVERVEQAAGFEIELLHHISVQPALRLAAKLRRGVDDRVHHRMREVEHERLVGITLVFEVIDRLVRVELDQSAHVASGSCGLVVFMQVHHAGVIRTEGAVKIIEPLRVRHAWDDRFPIGNIPLADAGGLVVRLADQLRPGDLLRRHAPTATADRLPSGQQRRARRPANRLRIKRGEPRAFLGQLIQPRRLVFCVPVTSEVRIALVIGENDQDIGFCGSRVSCRSKSSQRQCS